ncbi:MAG TPA: vanadium-dependent haloperoxidase [Chthoniobacterales bacterium]|nr:vanadium-dependent haloperoxidase [Chthoniobacterales bacterium]
MKVNRLSLAVAAAAVLSSSASHSFADQITDWNLLGVQVSKAQAPFTGTALNTNLASRILAIESVAVYNAVNSIVQYGTPYGGYATAATSPASPEAAAVQAAHDVLVNYFPTQQATLDAQLATSLGAITAGAAKTNGIAAGSAAAAHIIALRANDGSSPNTTYAGPGAITPGDYQLTPNTSGIPAVTTPTTFNPGINSQWGGVTPFVLASASQFRPVPPPALTSPEYLKALAEAKALGTLANARHTDEQTHITQFYKQDAEITVNEAARLLSIANNFTLSQNALLFAQLNIAVADTRIAEWDAKYFYKFWRPVTALNANPDGTVTNSYAAWVPVIVTPNHPSYPSGHSGTVVGVEVLRYYFGDKNTLTLHTTTAGEPARTVTSLTQIEVENGLSRIYGGIHFSFDNKAGQILGLNVANYAISHGPQKLN